jgi:CubicO group peptidase (beta-lactamase class C family)
MKKYIGLLLIVLMLFTGQFTVLAFDDTFILPSGLKSSEIESVIDSYVKENERTTAAVSIAVFTGDKVIFEKAYGNIDVENGIKNDSDAVFEWGSCTKLLVWTSVMQLVEQGKIDLSKDIRTYLPDGFFTKLKYDDPITMVNLMNHNAGWQETVTDLFVENKSDIRKLGDALKVIEPEQVNEPGRVVAYSNWGTALGGYIVELITGQSFDDYVHEHIFEPLGMKHTALNADLSDNTWVKEKREKVKYYTAGRESLGKLKYYLSLYPAGGATGTLSDFIKFAQAFVPEKGERSALFERRETLDEALSPSLYFADGKTGRNSHGFWTDELGVPVLWHNGGTNGSTSWFAFDPVSGTGVVILTNQSGESVYTCGVLPMVFGRLKYAQDMKNSQDILGVYVSSRTCFEGYAKLYSMLCHIQVTGDGEGEYKVPGKNFTLTGIEANSYVMDMGGVKQYLVHANQLKDGTAVLQMPGSDYIEVNGYVYIAKWILLLSFVIAALISVVSLPIKIIRTIRHNRKQPFTFWRIAVNAAVIISAVMFAHIFATLSGRGALFSRVQWSLILNGFCAIIPIAYLTVLIMKWRKTELTKKQRLGLILTGAGGLVMTINVIFWNAFIFW